MLVLTRETNESIFVILNNGEKLEVKLLLIRGRQARIGFTGCKETFTIKREELEEQGPTNGKITP